MSTFDGLDLFGSGPCTFTAGPRGSQWARNVDLGTPAAGIQVLGGHTVSVEVRGRLTAATAPALKAVTDALEAAAGVKADLIDDTGRTWPDLTLIEIVYEAPPESGRLWSIPYRAYFVGA
ncbi:MAG TPA: hypothetical protein VFF65_13290 [Phycisphaerales bacterium]|nr:hypothetical protein [Phycisphaerales bacterium]